MGINDILTPSLGSTDWFLNYWWKIYLLQFGGTWVQELLFVCPFFPWVRQEILEEHGKCLLGFDTYSSSEHHSKNYLKVMNSILLLIFSNSLLFPLLLLVSCIIKQKRDEVAWSSNCFYHSHILHWWHLGNADQITYDHILFIIASYTAIVRKKNIENSRKKE